jgi:hypothetical protein
MEIFLPVTSYCRLGRRQGRVGLVAPSLEGLHVSFFQAFRK